MTKATKILREPLLHFLVLGVGLFGLVGGPAEDRADQIVISAAKVENLAGLFQATWRQPPSRAELDGLIADHLQEEILYREALGLDDDIVIRRLRQKMEFISEDLAQRAEPTEAELQAFLAEHAERFREPSRISLAQVYLSPDRRDDARRDAERMLVALDAGRSDPAAAGTRSCWNRVTRR